MIPQKRLQRNEYSTSTQVLLIHSTRSPTDSSVGRIRKGEPRSPYAYLTFGKRMIREIDSIELATFVSYLVAFSEKT